MKVKHWILRPVFGLDGQPTGSVEWRYHEFDPEKQPLDAKVVSTPAMARSAFLDAAERQEERLLRQLATVRAQMEMAKSIEELEG